MLCSFNVLCKLCTWVCAPWYYLWCFSWTIRELPLVLHQRDTSDVLLLSAYTHWMQTAPTTTTVPRLGQTTVWRVWGPQCICARNNKWLYKLIRLRLGHLRLSYVRWLRARCRIHAGNGVCSLIHRKTCATTRNCYSAGADWDSLWMRCEGLGAFRNKSGTQLSNLALQSRASHHAI